MISIGAHQIGASAPPFVIAELSGNHDGSLAKALATVEAIAASGAHALKLQTYTAETMTLDIAQREFVIDNPASLWLGRTLYSLYHQAPTPWEWNEPPLRRARELGLVAFSSPFDATAVEFLESLDVPAYKIASFENVDLDLVRRVARTGQPVHHLHRAGDARRNQRGGGCGARGGLRQSRAAEVHEQLSGGSLVFESAPPAVPA